MKNSKIIILAGILLMSLALNQNIDYTIAIILSAFGGILTIAGVVLYLKARRVAKAAAQAAAMEAAQKAKVQQIVDAEMKKAEEQKAVAARQAQEAEEAAAAARRDEWERTHGRFVTNIAGVTFDNDDGSSRQKILKGIMNRGGEGEVTLEEYTYKGHPAVHVLIDGACIGNIPKDRVPEARELMDKEITAARLDVEKFRPEDDEDRPAVIYRADLTMVYKK